MWFLGVRSVFWAANSVFFSKFSNFFKILLNEEAKTHPNHTFLCEFDNMTKKMCCTPYPLKTAIFYTKMGPNGSKKFFFIIFLFVFLHRYLVFHKMFILHLFRKLKTKKLIKCVIFGVRSVFWGANSVFYKIFKIFFRFLSMKPKHIQII